MATDVSSAFDFFSARFGPPELKTLTVSPIPGAFGQGFPGLIYLSMLAYLDPCGTRPLADTSHSARTDLFPLEFMEAHETAHQWWGNIVAPGGLCGKLTV